MPSSEIEARRDHWRMTCLGWDGKWEHRQRRPFSSNSHNNKRIATKPAEADYVYLSNPLRSPAMNTNPGSRPAAQLSHPIVLWINVDGWNVE